MSHWQCQGLMWAHFLVCRWPLSPGPHMAEGVRELSGVSHMRH